VSGVDVEIAEFFMGHSLDQYGYDKSPYHNPEWFREQYMKAEPWLNILSDDPEKIKRNEIAPLRKEIYDLKSNREMIQRDNLALRDIVNLLEDRLDSLESKIPSSNWMLEDYKVMIRNGIQVYGFAKKGKQVWKNIVDAREENGRIVFLLENGEEKIGKKIDLDRKRIFG
jgi:hypothetical protein